MQRGLLPVVLCAALLGSLPLQTALGQSDETAQLSLGNCLRTALANNLELVAVKKDPAIAEQQIGVGQGKFDGELRAWSEYSEGDGDETFNSTQDTSSESDDLTGWIRYSQLLEFGGSYSAQYDYFDTTILDTTIPQQTGLLTGYGFDMTRDWLTLEFKMPLLSNFGKEVTTVDVLLARGGLEISREDLRLKAMQTAKLVEDAYWDVLATREALRISRMALKRAEDLLELNKKKVEVGTLAPIEITEAEAGVASQVEMVIVAEADLENAEDVLLQLMGVAEDDPMWEQALDITDRPSFVPVDVDLEEAIATALERRPEITAARRRLRDDELSERVAKRRLRQDLELVARLMPIRNEDTDQTVQILDIAPPPPPIVSATETEDTEWVLGLTYIHKFRNRKDKAEYAIAKLTAEKSDVTLRNVEQEIRVDVRKSVRNLDSGLKRVEAASKNVELQQKKLEAEQKKFDNGMSTSFEVLTFQNDLADSELKEIRARLDFVKSQSALEQSKGTLLEARGLNLAE